MRTVLLSYISSLQYGYHLCHYVEHAPSSDENNIFTSGTLCVGACTPSSGIEFFSKNNCTSPAYPWGYVWSEITSWNLLAARGCAYDSYVYHIAGWDTKLGSEFFDCSVSESWHLGTDFASTNGRFFSGPPLTAHL